MKRDWKKVRKEVKEFVENEVYPAEEILQKRDEKSSKKCRSLCKKQKIVLSGRLGIQRI